MDRHGTISCSITMDRHGIISCSITMDRHGTISCSIIMDRHGTISFSITMNTRLLPTENARFTGLTLKVGASAEHCNQFVEPKTKTMRF